ncbi:YjjG family noncanonical pyrimidine nucleotidase [Staphylococcus canis]|uniref:Noncanonical pyrimidine nucleotidase, YjjG family n=1 Tax=Staphylococcus canis TaxID=2724942 RepID=A0ABS0T703_9STAP|nr:YjjG family noncanonical pyrimidine nucleotidase [Staphylococcus canis]MBI5974522.1 noncanonical pyrimidine nucleotidase, YjjG family [Staphylococcus canis]
MRYKVILLDFDDTIVDFHDAEVKAYEYLMDYYNVPLNLRDYDQFKVINQAHWEAFQRGELSRREVLSFRFIETFKHYGMTVDGEEADVIFRDGLAKAPIKLLEGMDRLLDDMKHKVTIAIVTNGVKDTQERRISQMAIQDMISHIFISDELGVQKPKVEFFEKVFEAMPEYERSDFLIVGDSLTSDIQGGINAGIDTCWYNHRLQDNQTFIQPTYTITHIKELHHIIY